MTHSFRSVTSSLRPTLSGGIGGCPECERGFAALFGSTLSGMEAVTPSEGRLRALLEAAMAIGSELSLDALLETLVNTAAELTGARYAALGVIDRTRRELERFVTTGVDEETHAAIGELPRGRGILGALIDDAAPLLLHDLHDDPRSVGFPPNHPPMNTFLGVPILLRGTAYGNFYLTEKHDGGDFTDADQEIVSLLAGQAAVAIENARLYEASTLWSKQLESMHEIGNALATETDLGELLDLIARRLRELLDARLVAVMLPAGEEELRFAAFAGEGGAEFLGRMLPRDSSKTGRVFDRGRSERSDSLLDDPEVSRDVVRGFGVRTGLWVPLIARSETIGVIAVHDKLTRDGRFTDNDLRLAETFASRAAVAVDLSQRIARDALRRIVDAQELERRRLARELHDETGQALSSILLGLKALDDKVEGDAKTVVADVRELVVATLQDVRQLAVDLRPKVLDDFGLVAALERLTETFGAQTGISVRFESGLGEERLPLEVETALYRIVQESLTNIVKHALAENVSIVLARKPGAVVAVIEDDGKGFDPDDVRDGGFGVQGMRERVGLLDGRLQIESSEESGTTLVAEVPLA
jgi:signal transduction histidine kinase